MEPRFKKEGFRSPGNADQAAHIEKELKDICSNIKPLEFTDMNSSSDSTFSSLLDFVDRRVAGRVKSSRADSTLMIRLYFENDFIKKD